MRTAHGPRHQLAGSWLCGYFQRNVSRENAFYLLSRAILNGLMAHWQRAAVTGLKLDRHMSYMYTALIHQAIRVTGTRNTLDTASIYSVDTDPEQKLTAGIARPPYAVFAF
jgi:hypothetical protein